MTKTITVERVPLGYRPVDTPPAFPPLPVLYLEFLENKEKVRPELRDKPSAPIFLPETKSPESQIRSKLNERMKKPSEPRVSREVIRDHHSVRERMQEEDRDREKSRAFRDERPERRDERPERRDERPERRAPDPERPERRAPDPEHEPEHEGREGERPERREPREDDSRTREIQEMLGGAPTPLPPVISAPPVPAPTPNLPPTLDQLGGENVNVGGRVVKDISYSNEDEQARKRDLLFRFDILRKSYKEATIPEISEFTDLRTMERVYDDTVRRVALDSKVEGYKKFLQMGFFGIEFLFSNLFKIDMAGFAKQQLMSMNSYERILIELGEKSLLDKTKSQWPAEVRLLFTIVMNGVMFVLMKSVMNGGLSSLFGGGAPSGGGGGGLGGMMGGLGNLMGALGGMGGGGGGGGLGGLSDIMGMMGGLGGTPAPGAPAAPAAPEKAARKMRGPQINVDEIGKKTN
jgi:hypothetical protein